MKAYSWIILLGLLLTPSARATPDGFIWLDVSVKLVVNPATGQPPAGTDDGNFRQVFVLVNRWLANTWRGCRGRPVNLDSNQNFKRIGGPNGTAGPSKWYDIDLKVGAANLDFENAATANPPLFGSNSTAVNLAKPMTVRATRGGHAIIQIP